MAATDTLFVPAGARTDHGRTSATAAGAYTLCVRFEIDTTDSGFVSSRGYTEDYWTTANDGIVVPAYGIRVKVGITTYDTDAATGCVSFDAPSATQNVRVYGYATNANDSFVRMHDAGLAYGNCVPSPGDTQYLAGGANEADWTRMLWDMWTDPAVCSPAPSSTDMLRIYAATSVQPNFQHHLGWIHSQDAVAEVIASGQLGACYAQYWDDLGAYNGVDH